ncbi:hypothetical protein MAPG_10307 [Magnaporthiopsis poae ATCC 64411]|uniref:PD-(D/E)XK nuclease-like domain-containing protein n=1 Tax=Magnaporthiopsis poae (strain ATCC 64411 / 73-15) TaxID=644358 RepID=A0A0C4EC93_MAGP6|nr:hypothetical protein MAPG_10307 [Magnaporthiopsis poae ATCC 64411]
MADMQTLAKPVQTTSLSVAKANLPPDLSALLDPIEQVMIDSVGFVLAEAREGISQHLQAIGGRMFPDSFFATAVVEPEGTRSAEEDLQELLEIQAQALEASVSKASEAAWNLDVHGPMLKLATRGSGVRRLLVTTATVSPEWLPLMRGVEAAAPQSVSFSAGSVSGPCYGGEGDVTVAGARMVDFALVLQVASTPLEAPIYQAVYRTGYGVQPINHSAYTPLLNRPIGVSIETKNTGRNLETAQVRLSLWAVAWLRRMEALGNGARVPLAMPVIQVVGHIWKLSFVCDLGEHYETFEDGIAIGSTDSLVQLYKLLAVLRILIRWMDTEFRATIAAILDAN